MKPRTIIVAVGLLALIAVGLGYLVLTSGRASLPGKPEVADAKSDLYVCPMHPSVRSDRPGACPVCGMALVKRSSLSAAPAGDLDALRRVSLSPTQRVMANISTVPVARRAIARPVQAVGVVAVAEPSQATVSARFSGRIERLLVNTTGVRVERGEPLFEIYSPDLVTAEREYRLALVGASTGAGDSGLQAQLRQAARTRLLVHFGLGEEQVYDLEKEGDLHARLPFLSPSSGTVLRKQIQEGQYVEEGMVLYELADLSRLWVNLEVYEKDIRLIRRGQRVEISTTTFPGRTFRGEVTFIDPVVGPETRTVRVRSEVPNPDGALKPNMYVRATILVPAETSLVVPSTAVLSTGRRNVVWVEVGENSFEQRDIETGVETGEMTAVLAGLKEGERVASTGGYLLDSESTLQHPAPDAPQAPAGRTHGVSDSMPAGVSVSAERTIRILVRGSYSPSEVKVKGGGPVALEFFRDEDSPCTEEVVFPTLDIRRRLPAFASTRVIIAARGPGEIPFECGMGMVQGTLIVEP